MRENLTGLRRFVVAAFFLSGAAGLIYEIVWSRMLGLVFGNTSHAVATVIAAYMLGLGLGSYLLGRVADRMGNGLLLYSLLELAIGIYCFFTPQLFRGVESLYIVAYGQLADSPVLFTAFRFVLCFSLLVIPTLFMGGTLPALGKFFIARFSEFGGRLGLLYGINTLGAVAGCAAAGFLLVPWMGVQNTIILAACINCFLGGTLLLVALRLGPHGIVVLESEGAARAPLILPRLQLAILLSGFALSGFAALTYEVAWARVFCLSMGSSIYAFSAILTGFLLGIGIGSLLYSWLKIEAWSRDIRWFAAFQFTTAFIVLLLLIPFGLLPYTFANLFSMFYASFNKLMLAEVGVCVALLLIPTTIMGITFPLVAGLAGASLRQVGRGVGTVYAVNTIGTIAGSLAAGFLLIPSLGIESTIKFAALLNLTVGAAIIVVYRENPVKNCLAGAVAASIIVVTLAVAPPWHRTLLVSAPYWGNPKTGAHYPYVPPERELLFYKDGLNATVSVERQNGHRWVSIDGKPEASLTPVDMYNQLFVGHVPILLTHNPQKVLLIGLGSGITLGAMATHREVEELYCVEMEEAMITAAGFFSQENRHVLENPKTRLIVNDGRNYILATKEKFDTIVSEPSNPWMAGVSNLFTLEFLQNCRSKLNPDGVMCLWFHTYSMSLEDTKMIIRTFLEVFPDATLWFATTADVFLIGRKEPGMKPSFSIVKQRILDNDEVSADLKSLYILEPDALLTCFLLGSEELAKFARDARIHTDDHPILEFSAPKNIFKNTKEENFDRLWEIRSGEHIPLEGYDPESLASPEFYYRRAVAYEYKGLYNLAWEEARKALALSPDFAPAQELWERLRGYGTS